ncbi:muconolactone Delta-isomerase family protein [Mycobacterium vicinigordonae]|uniref:Muconolactone Delta-isomerase family protein n=1 Tax=Mycobacterium vicinigordonae TaxID=1719132 RepID=A0A7D6E6N8_9MYCO|nr:muconolactone Delta-isomerase family protein [Mycobacterium vicinigordonae]QLL08003.1 muconolactone Delta-isomerase family protein [Mycobacterium vicinigordonae]
MSEFLVASAIHLPAGTAPQEVAELGARHTAATHRLATAGRLLRLWRPPGEWRTIALFSAQDHSQLEQLLSTLPLRSWSAEEVTALGVHPDDPAGTGLVGRPGKGPEFLVTMTVTVPSDTPAWTVEQEYARSAGRARDLAARGHLVRQWVLPAGPDGPRTLGLWRARDPGELMAIVESLPLSGWMTIETTPLSPHPDDPIRMR